MDWDLMRLNPLWKRYLLEWCFTCLICLKMPKREKWKLLLRIYWRCCRICCQFMGMRWVVLRMIACVKLGPCAFGSSPRNKIKKFSINLYLQKHWTSCSSVIYTARHKTPLNTYSNTSNKTSSMDMMLMCW